IKESNHLPFSLSTCQRLAYHSLPLLAHEGVHVFHNGTSRCAFNIHDIFNTPALSPVTGPNIDFCAVLLPPCSLNLIGHIDRQYGLVWSTGWPCQESSFAFQ